MILIYLLASAPAEKKLSIIIHEVGSIDLNLEPTSGEDENTEGKKEAARQRFFAVN